MLDIRQTQQYANYLQKNGWTIDNNKGNYIFIRKIPIIGSIIKIQDLNLLTIKKLKNSKKNIKHSK